MSDQTANPTRNEEVATPEVAETTREARTFVPRTDIYENGEAIHVLCEMPGVDEGSVDITLEKNVLSLYGRTADAAVDGKLVAAEYQLGDYQRSFTLSEQVDRDGIAATMNDGVLTLVLPKAREARARRIEVRTQ